RLPLGLRIRYPGQSVNQRIKLLVGLPLRIPCLLFQPLPGLELDALEVRRAQGRLKQQLPHQGQRLVKVGGHALYPDSAVATIMTKTESGAQLTCPLLNGGQLPMFVALEEHAGCQLRQSGLAIRLGPASAGPMYAHDKS